MLTSSLSPFLLRVFIMNSLARCGAGCGSRGRITILLSRGSPGTICQWWNMDRQKACPCVCVRRSVSKPKESMAGMKALMVYSGEPGTGASWVT
uniref:Secreted protein n=1 Tax=Ixodes ricinus TaxID=34613 RepID=A0A6B0U5B3_IXORI